MSLALWFLMEWFCPTNAHSIFSWESVWGSYSSQTRFLGCLQKISKKIVNVVQVIYSVTLKSSGKPGRTDKAWVSQLCKLDSVASEVRRSILQKRLPWQPSILQLGQLFRGDQWKATDGHRLQNITEISCLFMDISLTNDLFHCLHFSEDWLQFSLCLRWVGELSAKVLWTQRLNKLFSCPVGHRYRNGGAHLL